jgi:prepilin-type N-terminal cleavage/methylation domain-containing protein
MPGQEKLDEKHAVRGATLIELIVVVAIIGILAAVALPILGDYIRDARLSEAVTNVQGIIEAEHTYFTRFQRFTESLGWCPADLPDPGESKLWPAEADLSTDCEDGDGWALLSWKPDDAVAFRYRVFTAYDANGAKIYHPIDNAPDDMNDVNTFAVDWEEEINSDPDGDPNTDDMMPWCAVEAQADTDGDGVEVHIRANSYNNRHYRHPNPDADGVNTW